MSNLRVALIQIALRDGEPAGQRLERGLSLLESVRRPVDLVLFPELWTVGFFNFADYARVAEPLDGPIAARFSSAARNGSFWLHAGSMVERGSDGGLYNTSLLFDREGRLAASYRKTHLFSYQSEENKVLQAGDAVTGLATEIGHLGLTTCYDLRFPELYRCLSSRGVEINLIPATWPAARLEHWVLLTRARAVENLSYVLACNAAGSNGGHELGGNSLIIDPWGKVLAQASSEETILYGEIDRNAIVEIRGRFPALRDRRW